MWHGQDVWVGRISPIETESEMPESVSFSHRFDEFDRCRMEKHEV